MLTLDVPFLSDPLLVGLLQRHGDRIHSVHFSLSLPGIADGRHRTGEISLTALNHGLRQLPSPKKYALLNSRFQHPDLYTDQAALTRLLDSLTLLLADGNLNGVIVVDFYLLQALSDTSPEVCSQLEAIPGINCMLDSFDRIASYCTAIARTHFRQPRKINLDRSLNRNIPTLRAVCAQCRKHFPETRLTLLANEGCLHRCPFKLTHDAHIALAATGLAPDMTYNANRELGCIRVLQEHPEELFRSPFIRPEDMHHYDGLVDVIKLCGRTLGPAFLGRLVPAYTQGHHNGNLLDLLDTQEWLAKGLDVHNDSLPKDFFRKLTSCDHCCDACGYCRTLFHDCAEKKQLTLPDLRQP